jgi:hypothetical protein
VNTAERLPMKIFLCFVVYVIGPITPFAYSQKSRISLSSGNVTSALNANNAAQTNILMKMILKMDLI